MYIYTHTHTHTQSERESKNGNKKMLHKKVLAANIEKQVKKTKKKYYYEH